jgi:hypothetical protein
MLMAQTPNPENPANTLQISLVSAYLRRQTGSEQTARTTNQINGLAVIAFATSQH